MSGKNRFEGEKRAEDSRMSSDWPYNGDDIIPGYSMGLNASAAGEGSVNGSASCASDPLMNCGPDTWNRPAVAFNVGNSGSSSSMLEHLRGSGEMMRPIFDGGWNPVMKEGLFVPNGVGLLPRSLSELPSDLCFIERAARLSCFGNRNFRDMVNTFAAPESVSLLTKCRVLASGINISHGSTPLPINMTRGSTMTTECGNQSGSLLRNESDGRSLDVFGQGHGRGASSNESDEAKFKCSDGQEEPSMMEGAGGETCSPKGYGANKRKKTGQNAKANKINGMLPKSMEGARVDGEAHPRGEQNPSPRADHKASEKTEQKSQGTDTPKDEYIHVRARRGQATNSHSLAERVRREKISERMKFLQDLVPGCSKVTGKAVMLDEIINYVQSLQRQVEFLSMKLATVNPRLDFDIESRLTKDMFQPRAGPSSSLGFPPDVSVAYTTELLPSPAAQYQANLSISGHPSNLRCTLSSHLPTMGYKEPNAQLAHMWDDELHNIVHMGFGNSGEASKSQELDDSHQSGPMKSEP